MTKISVIFLFLSILNFLNVQISSNIRENPNWIEIWQSRVALRPTTPVIDIKGERSTRRTKISRSTTTEIPETTEESESETSGQPLEAGYMIIVELCIFDSDGTVLNPPGMLNDCFGYCQDGKFLTAYIYNRTFMACCCK